MIHVHILSALAPLPFTTHVHVREMKPDILNVASPTLLPLSPSEAGSVLHFAPELGNNTGSYNLGSRVLLTTP